MTPAAITLTVFLIAIGLFIADFLPMGLMVFMVPLGLPLKQARSREELSTMYLFRFIMQSLV